MAQNATNDSVSAKSAYDPDSTLEQTESSLKELMDRVSKEAHELQFPQFSRSDAVNLGLLILELATKRSLPVAIDIRRGDHILFHAALEGATLDNDIWIRAKSRTAVRFSAPSLLVGLQIRLNGGRVKDSNWLDDSSYAAYGGSFPVSVKGAGHVATATVSGLPQKADHDLVVEALRLFQLRSDTDRQEVS
jgi:uncharacterized protein (UPF0303 family)